MERKVSIMTMPVIPSPRGFQEADRKPEASTCAICAQPIRKTTASWVHESTGTSAKLPVRHLATPTPPRRA